MAGALGRSCGRVSSMLPAYVPIVILGAIGEYLGRLFLDHSKSPQFVVRYVEGKADPRGSR